jgi:hypothetical protein
MQRKRLINNSQLAKPCMHIAVLWREIDALPRSLPSINQSNNQSYVRYDYELDRACMHISATAVRCLHLDAKEFTCSPGAGLRGMANLVRHRWWTLLVHNLQLARLIYQTRVEFVLGDVGM